MESKTYRKKPVLIEAVQFIPSNPSDFKGVADWCGGERGGFGLPWHNAYIEIPTLEGIMRANYGDWIIKGVKGEFYPCKPDIFAMTYEPLFKEESQGEDPLRALAFAASVIKTGEPWSDTCEQVIGGTLRAHAAHPPSTT